MFTKQIITRFVFTILMLAGLLFSSLGIASVRAASITVNTDADEITTNGLCSLREAIINANNDAATYPDCTAGLGADTISFAESYTITLAGAELPLVRSEIIIKGNGAANTIVQANASPNAAQYRVISVGTFFASLTLDGLTVRNGRCTGVGCDGYGGAIYNRGDLGILNSTVSGNTATIAGAIYNAEGATLDITNSILSGNTAWLVGGAIYSDVVSRTVITNSAISVNKTTGNNNNSIYYGSGGGIFSYQGSVIVLGSVFFGNSAAVNGGAIYGVDAQVAISDSTLSGNYSDSGAAIYKDGGSLTIGNSTLSNNTVSFRGGGISNQSGTMNITNSILSGNIASLGNGGGIYNGSEAVLSLYNSILSGNIASSGNGGGIYNGSEAVLSLYNSTVSWNGAGKGGAIYVIEGSLTIGSSILSNNSAFINGGGIANESGTVNMTNSILSGNSAKENGAGIFSKSGSLTVTGSTITGNISDESGGGIYNTGAANNLGIYNSTLSRNSAATGGGIYNNINGKLWLGNTTVSGNEAYDYGGGIYSDGRAWIHNSTIVFNVLVEGTDLGAAGVDGDVAFYNSIVAGNTRLPTSEYRDCSGSSLLFGMNLFSNITNCAFIENPDLWGYLNSLSALGSLQDNGGPTQTHALLPGSNAIDAGDNTLCAGWPINNLDQRGVTRPQESQCDIGAYEYETVPPTSTPTITATPTSTFTPTNTFTPTDTSMPTNTFTPTLSISLTPTATPTNTFTPTPFISLTPTATPTNTFTPTPFNTLTPTSEHQYHFTPTPFNTRTPTSEHQHQFTPTPFNAPETRFIAMHVSKTNESSIYIFSFDSSGNNAYMCRMDQEAFSPCKNEITYSGLSAGSHTFQVYAIDPSGNPDPTPAEYSFMVTP